MSTDSFYLPPASQYLDNVLLRSVSLWSPNLAHYSWYITLNYTNDLNGIVCIRVNVTDNASTHAPILYGTQTQRVLPRLTTTSFRPSNRMQSTAIAVKTFEANLAEGTTFRHVLDVMKREMPGYQLPSPPLVHSWAYLVFQILAKAGLIHPGFHAPLDEAVQTVRARSPAAYGSITWPPRFGQIIKHWE